MNAFESSFPSPKKARIEIIPLIDVIFFLLATFVLFTLSLQKIKMIEVDLPVVPFDSRPNPDEDVTVYLQAAADGMYYWKLGRDATPEPITAPELAPRLQNYKGSVPVPRVLVRSDTGARFGAGVFALDEVRRAGIKQVSVETIASATGR
jgi:biopolymer transport protein ExbD